MSWRVGIVGGGIVGLTLARELVRRQPGAEVTVLEKELRVGRHQTGHNSGVVHAGLYYRPGSLKAELCTRGRGLLREFCEEHGLDYVESGKLVVARSIDEVPALEEIHRRSLENGVPDLARLDAGAIREVEPHVVGAAAIHSPHTAVVSFPAVAEAVAAEVVAAGGRVLLGKEVTSIEEVGDRVRVRTRSGQDEVFDRLVLCTGLQSDRVARLAGGSPDPAIVPFIGMYYAIRPGRRHLVRSLVYPVPDPRYPFLGVHLTRTVEGEVLVGPNAVLGLAREGYGPLKLSRADLAETLRWPGFRTLARRHWRQGVGEAAGASSRHVFAARARAYVPDLRDRDLVRAWSGVRAQAVWRDGELADDFVLAEEGRVLAVRNAPSPAATSSFAIAARIADRLQETP